MSPFGMGSSAGLGDLPVVVAGDRYAKSSSSSTLVPTQEANSHPSSASSATAGGGAAALSRRAVPFVVEDSVRVPNAHNHRLAVCIVYEGRPLVVQCEPANFVVRIRDDPRMPAYTCTGCHPMAFDMLPFEFFVVDVGAGPQSRTMSDTQHHHHSTAYAAPLPTSYSASAVTRARVRHGSQPGPLASSNPQPHQQRSSSSPGANQSASSPSSSSTSPDNSWLAMRSPRVWGYDSEDSALFEFPGAVILEEAVPEEPQVFLV